MRHKGQDGPLLVFDIAVPWGSSFGGSTVLTIDGAIAARRTGGWALTGQSRATDKHAAGGLGSLSIVWNPATREVECSYSGAVDGLSDFSFEAAVSEADEAGLDSATAEPLEVARCLLSAAEDFEPALPSEDLLLTHPYMAQVLA